jgi:hypothetical protein
MRWTCSLNSSTGIGFERFLAVKERRGNFNSLMTPVYTQLRADQMGFDYNYFKWVSLNNLYA